MKVAVLGFVRFSPQNKALILPHLKALVAATRQNDGCIAYDVAEDVLDPGLFRFSELWPDEASLRAHQKASHIAPWREACQKYGIMERQFSVCDVTNSRSL